jgi:hypothetical protein
MAKIQSKTCSLPGFAPLVRQRLTLERLLLQSFLDKLCIEL